MLLGVIGASLSFGWTPDTAGTGAVRRPYRPCRAAPSEGLNLVLPGRRARDTVLENPGLEVPGAAETAPDGGDGGAGPGRRDGRDRITQRGL